MPTVPTKIAERIGILRLPRTLKIRLVDGKEVYTEAGPVTHSCREIHVSASVVILHRAKLLLGAQALRILELTVSPRTGKVRRVRLKSSALSSAKGGKLHYALARSERPLNK